MLLRSGLDGTLLGSDPSPIRRRREGGEDWGASVMSRRLWVGPFVGEEFPCRLATSCCVVVAHGLTGERFGAIHTKARQQPFFFFFLLIVTVFLRCTGQSTSFGFECSLNLQSGSYEFFIMETGEGNQNDVSAFVGSAHLFERYFAVT
jgi:hypothetical protein